MREKRNNFILVILGIIVLFICLYPLFGNDFIKTHDDNLYPTWLYEFNKGIESGHFLPRWSPDFWLGFGSPLFNFIQPFFYYFSELFHVIGFGLVNSVKITIGLGFIFSFLFMYLFGKTVWNSKEGGFICAVFYTLFPYRLGLVYLRGDFSEFLATSLMPLILFSFLKLGQTKRLIYFLLSSLSLSLLCLTHNIQTLFFLPVLLIYLLIIFSKEVKKIILPFFFSGIFSLSIASFFILPAFFEKKYLEISALLSDHYDFHNHFLKLKDLLITRWESYNFYQIGAFGIIFFLFLIFVIIKRKITGSMKKNIYFFFFLIILSSLATLSFSVKFWELVPLVEYVQFPWRILSFQALAFGILGGILLRPEIINLFSKRKIPKLLLVLIFSGVIVFTNIIYIGPSSYLEIEDDQSYNPFKQIFSEANIVRSYEKENQSLGIKESVNIYSVIPLIVPKGTNLDGLKKQVGDLLLERLNNKEEEFRIAKINVLGGKAEWQERKTDSYDYSFEILSDGESSIRINNFWFIGWQAFLDNQEIDIQHHNEFQLMTFDVPAGRHMLQLKFSDTPIRKIGNLISLFSLVLWLILLIMCFIKKILSKTDAKFSH